MNTTHPILYSFRRCPYAMRARMALFTVGINCEIREVLLRAKPPHMLEISAKGTVPVLQLRDGHVLDESLSIMLWALEENDPYGWCTHKTEALTLIKENDGPFKTALDRYKYPNRYPEEQNTNWRNKGEAFLQKLEGLLSKTHYLHSNTPTLADYAIFPFIRQFRMPNPTWFDTEAPYPNVRKWLEGLTNSPLFETIMAKHTPYESGQEPVYLLKIEQN